LITGCSSGIGRDLAIRMTGAGYSVIATARNPETLDDLDCAMKLRLDVTDEYSVQMAVAAIAAQFDTIDVLVNSAGFAACGAVEELPDEAWRSMFEVNVLGAVRVLRAVAPIMRRERRGTIVNISSLAGMMSMPVNGGYSSTKFALEAISDAARSELAPFGVNVIVVRPGPIRTHFDATKKACSGDILGDPSSPYRLLYRRDNALADSMRDKEPGPEAVSRVVLRALSAEHPKTRYSAGIPLLAELLSRLNDSLKDRLWSAALERAIVPQEPYS
jgi:NAD(P)-dependent dehydrogenase (short-subunit alcohol dehydrogenase family)